MSEEKETSLILATLITLASFALALVVELARVGVNSSNFGTLFSHPAALTQFVAGALGASVMAPLIHLGIASLFKSKRNKNSRRRIFIGWGLVIIIANVLALLAARPL